MSSEISVAHVQQYSSNLFHLSQQEGSVLSGAVRIEMQKGKRKFYERLGLVEPVLKTSRHQDTPQNDTPHSRRAVDMSDYIQADMIDEEDLIRMLIDPQSAYVKAFANGFGRQKDRILITAMRGNAYSGENGATTVALPASQKVLCASENAPGTPSMFNIDLLRKLDYMFGVNNVNPQAKRHIAYTAKQKMQLLGSTEVTSSDYNTVKALVNGQINTFMGFQFHQTQLLPLEAATYNESTGAIDSGSGSISAADARRCLAWVEDGVILSIGKDIQARVDERKDKNYSKQVWTCMTAGATRLEEEKVIEIVCDESATA
jgi:hypothetical protein